MSVQAPPERVWDAFLSLPARDLRATRWLMNVRHAPARLTGRRPEPLVGTFLDVAPVPTLFVDPGRYVLAGGVGRPWTSDGGKAAPMSAEEILGFDDPGWVKLAADFSFQVVGGRTVVSTETRVEATDPESRRRMALYWTGIRLFSGLIRREVLHAIDARSTGPAPLARDRDSSAIA